jgi:hypothetical protein
MPGIHRARPRRTIISRTSQEMTILSNCAPRYSWMLRNRFCALHCAGRSERAALGRRNIAGLSCDGSRTKIIGSFGADSAYCRIDTHLSNPAFLFPLRKRCDAHGEDARCRAYRSAVARTRCKPARPRLLMATSCQRTISSARRGSSCAS